MAEHFEGAETPLRRSRRLGGRSPQDVAGDANAAFGAVKVTHAEVGNGDLNFENRNEGTLGTVEEAAEIHDGDTARGATEVTTSIPETPGALPSATTDGHVDGEKRKHPETAPGSCKRPLLETKVPQTWTNATVPKGKPKSGRVWKDPKKRFSVMVKDRTMHTSWDQKMKARQEKRMVKEFAQQLRDEKQKAKEEKKQRRAENLKRRLENERKAEIVQVITNTAKLKRAKKKQLRRIEKRDTLALLQRGQGVHKKGASKRKPKGMEKPVAVTVPNTN